MNREEFRRYAEQAFAPITERYGLIPLTPSTDKYANPYEARFGNSTTIVVVEGIHYGFGVDVRLASLNPDDMRFPTYAFGDLLALRAPGFKPIVPAPDDTNEIQKRQIDSYAAALPIYADDVLRGDFTTFPLLARAIQDRKERFARDAQESTAASYVAVPGRRRKPWWKVW